MLIAQVAKQKNPKAPPADPTDDEPESGPEGNDTSEPEATPATKKARGGGGKPKGAQKFTVRDESRLLDIVDVVHPIGGDMWERVSQDPVAVSVGLLRLTVNRWPSATISVLRRPAGSPATPNT
jgi:hypothetical protein